MNENTRKFIQIGSIMMATAVALGAFGAHGLKNIVDAYGMEIWQKAVNYHFYHALGLLFISFLFTLNINENRLKKAGYIMFTSILIFSGSLYIMALTNIKWLGAITPIGGVGFIISWMMIFYSLKK